MTLFLPDYLENFNNGPIGLQPAKCLDFCFDLPIVLMLQSSAMLLDSLSGHSWDQADCLEGVDAILLDALAVGVAT